MLKILTSLNIHDDWPVAVCAISLGVAVVLLSFVLCARRGDALRLREAVEAMPGGLAFYDAQDRLMTWNASYARYCAGTGRLWRGRRFADIVAVGIAQGQYPAAIGREDEWLEQCMAQREAGAGRGDIQTADGRWIRVTDRRTADGSTVTVCVDVTEARQAEAAIVQGRDDALAATRLKTQFLATMSHEIRTPLNGVMGMNALLLMTELTKEQRNFATIVQMSAEALLSLLNDILDLSKLEAGKVDLEAIDFDLRTVIKDVLELLGPRAGEKQIALAADCTQAAIPLCGDAHRLRQILLNLGSNAVKFTDVGRVSIVASTCAVDNGEALVRVDVHDTGIGVDDEVKARLFQTFQQADGSITRRYGGSGLGLSICRQLVELMGGQIGIADNPEGGSIFWFELRLPMAQVQMQSAVA